MNISAPFIARPIATTLLTAGIVLCGAAAFMLLPVAPLPRIATTTATMTASNVGGILPPKKPTNGGGVTFEVELPLASMAN